MIKHILAGLISALCLSAPVFAQTFSHTHDTKGYHSHDITTYRTTGTCCCCCNTHTSSELLGSAHHTTRTYVRRYTHPTVERKTYTRVVHPHSSRNYSGHHYSKLHHHADHHVVHRQHHKHPHKHVMTHDERRERDYARASEGHSDRTHAWAHYDRKWRSRTNDKRH